MRFLNGAISMVGGIIGVVLLVAAIVDGRLTASTAILSGLLILFGLTALWVRVTAARRRRRSQPEPSGESDEP